MTICLPLLLAASLVADAPPRKALLAQPANCQLILDGTRIKEVHLEGEDGRGYPVHGARRIALLRPGRYRVRLIMLEGDYAWAAPRDGGEWFTLRPDRPYHLRAGAPLVPKVDVVRQGRYLRMDYRGMADAGGRVYFGRNSAEMARRHPTRFVIFRGGRELAAGTLRYGRYG